ncbi:MAG: Mu transposase domain-containing protein, partial [Acidimicrobiales bacterium]
RTDRMATVCEPGSGRLHPGFASVARYSGVSVDVCPARRGNRKGAVECGVKFMCGRWWRTMTATTLEEAQVSLDRFWATTGDGRLRPPGRYADPDSLAPGERPVWPTVGQLADAEVLMALPAAPYPATVTETHPVDDRASVAFRGNRYSVNPGMGGIELRLSHRLGTGTVGILGPAGALLASHRLAPPGAGTMVRTPEHAAALEKVVLGQFTTARPCDRKANRPPGADALAERARLLGADSAGPTVDLDGMAEIVRLAFPGATDASGREVSA